MSGNYKGSGYFFSSGGEDASTSEQSTENQSGGGGWGFGSFLSSVTSKIKDVIEAEKSQVCLRRYGEEPWAESSVRLVLCCLISCTVALNSLRRSKGKSQKRLRSLEFQAMIHQ